MLKTSHFYALLCLLMGARLISMAIYPLVDTSEPRYAEVARLMLETNDWITPWFSPNVPFWGKPPLSFWAQAFSFKLFGISEFAVRLPSWLATLATTWLVYKLASAQFGKTQGTKTAQIAALIFCSCTLVFVASGAVLTDPFLALATTWAMAAYALAQTSRHWVWRYGFFVALGIGLLSKGPLVGVIVGGPILVGLAFHKEARRSFKHMPWFSGTALMLLVSLPWYIIAELKTPGFLNYFLLGEHFYRFIDPGWAGDLYGVAHKEPKGKIWIDFIAGAAPWSFVALFFVVRAFRNNFNKALGSKSSSLSNLAADLRNPQQFYLLSWALFTPVFFTVSGNILWTYVLPALPAFAILLAQRISNSQRLVSSKNKAFFNSIIGLAIIGPLACTIYFGLGASKPLSLKTEKYLVQEATSRMKPQDQFAYLDHVPFSANFYSKGKVRKVDMNALFTKPNGNALYLAVSKEKWEKLQTTLELQSVAIAQNRRYVLIKIESAIKP
jgi:4-amino-4-deoxy-L-arabinose transferase-like glycosyltransferase